MPDGAGQLGAYCASGVSSVFWCFAPCGSRGGSFKWYVENPQSRLVILVLLRRGAIVGYATVATYKTSAHINQLVVTEGCLTPGFLFILAFVLVPFHTMCHRG